MISITLLVLLSVTMAQGCGGVQCPDVPYVPEGRAEDCQSDDPCADDPPSDQMLYCASGASPCGRRHDGQCFCEEPQDLQLWAAQNCPDCLSVYDGKLALACGEG